jgi:hypothetical protein
MNNSSKRFLAVVGVLVLLFVFGIRIGHPQGGLGTSLGSAKSSLVVYRHGAALSKDSKAMVKSGNPAISPALGVVANADKDSYDVNTGKYMERIAANDVQGKLIIVIPFLGSVVGLVGL